MPSGVTPNQRRSRATSQNARFCAVDKQGVLFSYRTQIARNSTSSQELFNKMD